MAKESLRSKFHQLVSKKSDTSTFVPPLRPEEINPDTIKTFSSDVPLDTRLRILHDLVPTVLRQKLSDNVIAAVWLSMCDLVGPRQTVETRHSALTFLSAMVKGQRDHLGHLSLHFFRIATSCENFIVDITLRLELIKELTHDGRTMAFFEKELNQFISAMLPAVMIHDQGNVLLCESFSALLRQCVVHCNFVMAAEICKNMDHIWCELASNALRDFLNIKIEMMSLIAGKYWSCDARLEEVPALQYLRTNFSLPIVSFTRLFLIPNRETVRSVLHHYAVHQNHKTYLHHTYIGLYFSTSSIHQSDWLAWARRVRYGIPPYLAMQSIHRLSSSYLSFRKKKGIADDIFAVKLLAKHSLDEHLFLETLWKECSTKWLLIEKGYISILRRLAKKDNIFFVQEILEHARSARILFSAIFIEAALSAIQPLRVVSATELHSSTAKALLQMFSSRTQRPRRGGG